MKPLPEIALVCALLALWAIVGASLLNSDQPVSAARGVGSPTEKLLDCAGRLTNLSEHVGFGATFSVRDKTLVMSGSDLCDEGWLDTLPKMAKSDALASGFTHVECFAAGKHHLERIDAE